jgi:hypothetical protein
MAVREVPLHSYAVPRRDCSEELMSDCPTEAMPLDALPVRG